jgi:hypothetical protein
MKVLTQFFTKFQKTTLDVKPSIVTIPVEEQFEYFIDMKILHLSDLHINKKTTQQELSKLIDTINSTKIDFVALTGDIIDTKVSNIKEILLLLKKIQHPTYFVSGNHDIFYGYSELLEILTLCDIKILDNSYTTLQYKNRDFCIVGLSDRFSKYFKIKRDEETLLNSIKNKNKFTLFLAHQPKDYIYAINASAQLFLCGHTHGGQIYPFHYLVRLIQPFLNGLHFVNTLAIYVNKGIGTWGIGYRFLASSELPIIKLTKK